MNTSGLHILLNVKKWKYVQQPIFIYDLGVPRLSKTFDAYNISQLWQKTKCVFFIFHKPFKALYLPIITKLIFSHFSSISSGQLLSHRRFPRPAVARRRGASRSRSRCHSVLRRTGIKQSNSFSFGTHLISDKLCYQMILVVNSVVEEKNLNAQEFESMRRSVCLIWLFSWSRVH